MTEEQISEKLLRVFRNVFKDPNLELSSETSPSNVHNWNSLNNTIMLHEVEIEFGLKFGFAEILNINNVGDLIILIKSKFK